MRFILVGVDFGDQDFGDSFAELKLLAESAGAEVVHESIGKRSRPDAALFIGSGKADEIAGLVKSLPADGVIFNHALTPAQQRNLQRVFDVRVVDRTTLILDIFALRAQSHEGKLQVELAQLRHLSSRLVRQWSHLERQKGGVGMRGPGEKQLELDRRMLDARVKRLSADLARLQKQRETQRRARTRGEVFKVSLVGYTNAGKSTLFNQLTHAGVYSADQLFATLDTTTRRVYLGDGVQISLADTVGFIRELPHQLVEAFKATLEETVHADLLLHVIDAASESRDVQIAQVESVLQEIGADDIPCIHVLNKIDVTGVPPRWRDLADDGRAMVGELYLSARTGAGVELLREKLLAKARSRLHQLESHRDESSQTQMAEVFAGGIPLGSDR
ncbi:GTPase HflX [Piscinibacterium candidicorallinum]|jgi:GTP-binding protein HflX|uniref:GTPase HflX n=1 Tax=Piscinibacterium candidicorallinum TaxID=1793872 RepID=A0ABV7GZ15_9BURK